MQQLEAEKLQLQKINDRKRLYEYMENHWKKVEEENERKKMDEREKKRKDMNLDYENIKEHERRYEQIIKKQRDERQKKLNEMNDQFEKNQNKKIGQSRFFNYVQEQDAQKKDLDEEKKKFLRNNT